MFKYIVKRILISVVVLLGVSLILYTLVRMMPTNYVEIKYAPMPPTAYSNICRNAE